MSYKGYVTKRPLIETNDSTRYHYIMIRSYVTPFPDSTYPIKIEPYRLDISQFGDIVRDRINFTISNVSENNIKVSAIDIPSLIYPIDFGEEIVADDSVEYTMVLNNEGINNPFTKSITIQCDDNNNTTFTIPIRRTIRIP